MTSKDFKTIRDVITRSYPVSIICRQTREINGKLYYERYWKVALLLNARDKCRSVWVVGIKTDHTIEYKAGTSIAVLSFIREALPKMDIDSPNNNLIIFEPLGVTVHLIKTKNIRPHLLITPDDTEQQKINFDHANH